MDIQIKSYLCSDEQDFIHHYGTNTGFTLVYNKVLKSMLISAEAKVLYMLICSYAFGEKDYSFPSQYEMCTRLGWTVDTLKKYLNELEEKGLIKIEISRNMKTLIYKITKLNEVKILYHSELLEMIKPKSARALKKFIKRLREYMASDLFQEVNQAEDPFVYINEVKQFFFDVEDSQEQDEEFPEMSYFKTINNKEESKVGEVKEIKSDGGGGKEENPSLLKYKQQAKQVAQKIDYSGIQKVDAEKTTINIKKAVDKNYENKPIEEWNSRDFCRYFADRYEEKMGVSLKGNFMKMVSQMKLLIGKHQDNQLLKRMIDVFMNSDIFEVKSFSFFISEKTQGILDYYLVNNTFPSWVLVNHEKAKRKEAEIMIHQKKFGSVEEKQEIQEVKEKKEIKEEIPKGMVQKIYVPEGNDLLLRYYITNGVPAELITHSKEPEYIEWNTPIEVNRENICDELILNGFPKELIKRKEN